MATHTVAPGTKETVTLADIEVRFGAYRIGPRVHWNSPGAAVFQLDGYPSRPSICRIVVYFTAVEGTPDTPVRDVTVMPDLRLPAPKK